MSQIAKTFGLGALQFYMKNSLVQEFDNLSSLCLCYGIPLQSLTATLEAYATVALAAKEKKLTDEFGKSHFPADFSDYQSEKMYAAVITPVLHYTMGGLKVCLAETSHMI